MTYANLRQELEDAAFRPHLRDALYQSLHADADKLAKVRAHLAMIDDMVPTGILDRDAISKHIHEMLHTMMRRMTDEPPPASTPARIVQE